MKDYLVTRRVVVKTADKSDRYEPGEIVSLKKADADRLNKKADSSFLELVKSEKTVEEVAD